MQIDKTNWREKTVGYNETTAPFRFLAHSLYHFCSGVLLEVGSVDTRGYLCNRAKAKQFFPAQIVNRLWKTLLVATKWDERAHKAATSWYEGCRLNRSPRASLVLYKELWRRTYRRWEETNEKNIWNLQTEYKTEKKLYNQQLPNFYSLDKKILTRWSLKIKWSLYVPHGGHYMYHQV